jgi:solute:Na+ symporter, SSS family
MIVLDYAILIIYLFSLLFVGFYFSRQNKNQDDYFLGGRRIKYWHVGLSVVATDVGGGFSIGLGGLGFTLGLSGSWMLFTGLLGAWLSAVFLIPRIKRLEQTKRFFTFNDIIGHYYGRRTALIATLISLVGYLGFTSSQLLAGAKLATATFNVLSLEQSLWAMGMVTIIYTAFGGLKAVIYTDTVQWIILMVGLILVGIPMAWFHVGGWEVISTTLPATHFSFGQLSSSQIINWSFTIIPIWFIGLTLYQRIYACSTEREAKQAWYLAGLLEWPLMAFMGTILGMLARVAFEENLFADLGFPASLAMDPEMALPLLLQSSFAPGFLGLMLAAYFSAILSTADSCLMAASGSAVSDLYLKFKKVVIKDVVRLSKLSTLLLGLLALLIASNFSNVLSLMLLSYGVMVSGLFVPVLGALLSQKNSPAQGTLSILLGGGISLGLQFFNLSDIAILWGILASALGYGIGTLITPVMGPQGTR